MKNKFYGAMPCVVLISCFNLIESFDDESAVPSIFSNHYLKFIENSASQWLSTIR